MDVRLLTFRNLLKFFKQGDTKTLAREYSDLFCLMLSQLVYFSKPFITKNLTEIGATIRFIDYSGPLITCVSFDGVTYVSAKGVSGNSGRDWRIILNFLPKKFNDISAHRGFVNTVEDALGHVKAFTEFHDNPQLVLTGHSMGGAIVTLMGLEIAPNKIVTFGTPKLLEDKVSLVNMTITNYLISGDPITKLPPFMYQRPGTPIILKRKFNLLHALDNHKLFTYSEFIKPLIMEAASTRLALPINR